MPTPLEVGSRIENVDLLELLPPDEGEINQYYGRIGSGKTYAATADVIRELERGQIVYANWKIKWEGYDERKKRFLLFLGLLGLKRHYAKYPKNNLHFFEIKDSFVEDISKLTDCKIYLDEGHIAFDSYEMAKMKIEKRTAVLHTRHFDRTIIVISQRPTAIHVTLRANVNRFYKCEKTTDWNLFWKWRIQRFLKTEFQDVTQNDVPDETKIINEETHEETDEYAKAVSTESYWGKKKIFQAYDTKYRREGMATSQTNFAQIYYLKWIERFKQIINLK